MFLLSGLSKLTRAIRRRHRLPRFRSRASSPNDNTSPADNTSLDNNTPPDDNTSVINNEESRTKHKSSGDECLSPGPTNTLAGLRRNTTPYDEDENFSDSDDEGNTPTINDIESLKRGIIKTSEHVHAYTILLVGETSVGKSSVLELIANVLIGNDVDHFNFDILDRANEQGGSDNQSQTNAARMYEFTSKNGVMVRILDTPGLADSRGVQQDELHKRSIATQIKDHIDSITAVLILANGTMPRVTVGTDYTLSTLSNLFPKSLASNTAFMFTNVSSPLHFNFSRDTLPDVLRDAPLFLFNNPIALQKQYRRLRYDPYMKISRAPFRKEVKARQEDALDMLVDLLDWLDGLEPQPTTIGNATTIIADPYTSTYPPMDQAVSKGAEHPADMNQKPPSNHTLSQSDTDNATLLRRKGGSMVRSGETWKEAWRRHWGS